MTKIQFDNRRSVEEWVGATPDAAIPARVKLSIFERCGGRCGLTGKKLGVGEFDYDHITRLRDGGEHRETNLHVVSRPAHREKTAEENSDGAHWDRVRQKHLGIYPKSKTPLKSRGFQKRAQP